jgi:hypothetical protein
MVHNARCIYYQNVLHNFILKKKRYIFIATTATIDDYNYFTCIRFSMIYTSSKLMSCTKMLYMLIRNSLTSTQH